MTTTMWATTMWALALALAFAGARANGEVATPSEGDGPNFPNGFLLVHKDFEATDLTVGMNLTVSVEIHNGGSGPAYEVEFVDAWERIVDFGGNPLKLVEGPTKQTYKRIAAGDFASFRQVFQAVNYGAATLPKTITTYKESEGASDRVKVTSPSDEFSVLSKAQATTASILGVGKYVSLGFCKTTLDWIRLAVFVAVVTGTIALRKSFVTISEVQDARRRKRARKALGVEEIMKDS